MKYLLLKLLFISCLASGCAGITPQTVENEKPADFVKRLENGEKVTVVTLGTSLLEVAGVGWMS